MEPAGLDPRGDRYDARSQVTVDELEERERPADRGDDHAEDGHALRNPVAGHPAQQAGDDGADQRGEDGDDVEHVSLSSG